MIRQFFNTLNQIAHSDSVNPIRGTYRHLQWQARKTLRRFPCELPIGSSRLFVDYANAVAALVNAMGLYDFNNMSLLQALLREIGGVFVDVGANVGSYTLVASEVPSSRVISIEPHPRAFRLLTENVKRNRRSNVKCLRFALSDHDGWCSFTDGDELSVNHIASSEDSRNLIRVPTRTLRSVCSELEILPDFVKIDVEGHEGPVLDGLGGTLSAAKVMWIERGERYAIQVKLQQAGYLGPLYVHYLARKLGSTPAKRAEDPVFVRRDCVDLLERCGFRIQARTAKGMEVRAAMPGNCGVAGARLGTAQMPSIATKTEERPAGVTASKAQYPRVVLLTNIISPYLVPVLSALSRRLRGLRIMLSAPMERGRPWPAKWDGLDVVVQKSFSVEVKQSHPQGFSDRVARHFPYDTLAQLIRLRPSVIVSAQLGFRTIQAILYRTVFKQSKLVIWVDASEHTERRLSACHNMVRRALLRHADAVLAVGKSGKRYVESLGVCPDCLIDVPYVTDPQLFRTCDLHRAPDAAHRLIYVGQLIDRKGLLPFLHELVHWSQRNPARNSEWWLVGDGPLRTSLQRVRAPDNLSLKFLGNVPYGSLADLYGQAGICVLPTLADTWGLVVNESLAAGLPVLGSLYSQAVSDLIEDGINGWTYRPDAEGDTQRALDQALNASSAQLAGMRVAARQSISFLTPEYAADRFVRAIRMARASTSASFFRGESARTGEP